jgi:hypothetical protein
MLIWRRLAVKSEFCLKIGIPADFKTWSFAKGKTPAKALVTVASMPLADFALMRII